MPTFCRIKALWTLLLCSWIGACTPADESGYYKDKPQKSAVNKDSLPLLFYDTTWFQQTVEQQRDLLQLIQQARSRSSSAAIRRMAQVLEREHAAVLQEAEQLAGSKNWSLPTTAALAEGPDGLEQRKEARPGTWDRKWLRLVVHQQEELTDRLEATAAQVGDGDLRAWIVHAVPRMRRLYTEVAKVRDSLKPAF